MRRVTSLYVGVLELLKHGAFFAAVARPHDAETAVQAFGLRAKEAQVVNVRRIKGADQEHAVVKSLGRLMKVERRVLVEPPLDIELGDLEALRGCREPL